MGPMERECHESNSRYLIDDLCTMLFPDASNRAGARTRLEDARRTLRSGCVRGGAAFARSRRLSCCSRQGSALPIITFRQAPKGVGVHIIDEIHEYVMAEGFIWKGLRRRVRMYFKQGEAGSGER
jgi:hypothetical protein